MASSGDKPEKKEKKSQVLRELIDKEEYMLRKRLPPRLPVRPNDIYISCRTNFKAQLVRCQKMLDSKNEVFIHGLGSAVTRAINLALQLREAGMGTLQVAVHTSSVELVDDLQPTTDDLEPETQTRQNSAVHIRVYRLEVPEVETS